MLQQEIGRMEIQDQSMYIHAISHEEEVDKLGWQYESSIVIGVDFYLYEKKNYANQNY